MASSKPGVGSGLRSATRALIVLCAAASFACSHAAVSGGGARQVQLSGGTHAVRAAELQQDLERFTGQFMDRVTQVAHDASGEGASDPVSDQLFRLSVVYASSALDVATESLPELGVLDMVVFLRLSREVLAEHWVPNVLGERGRPLLEVFVRAEKDFEPIADKILSTDQKRALAERIDQWRRSNPELVNVAAVRLTDFSKHAGAVAVQREQEAQGLFASVMSATSTGDEAILLGERALFLANRLPFLLRMQARLAAREATHDAREVVTSTESLATSAKEVGPLVAQTTNLVAASNDAIRESRQLVDEVKPLIPSPEQVDRAERGLTRANDLVVNTTSLVGDLRAASDNGPDGPMAHVAARADASMTRALLYLMALGAAWSLLWWTGYVLAKRWAVSSPPSRSAPPAPSS